jgi:hypothetical protein
LMHPIFSICVPALPVPSIIKRAGVHPVLSGQKNIKIVKIF